MSEEEQKPCVCCGGPSDGLYGSQHGLGPDAMPVCNACFGSGKLMEWVEKASAEIKELGQRYGCMPWEEDKSLLWHLEQYRALALSSIRMEDGVCPNGCAKLEMDGDPYNCRCTVCKFQGHSNVPYPFFNMPEKDGFD